MRKIYNLNQKKGSNQVSPSSFESRICSIQYQALTTILQKSVAKLWESVILIAEHNKIMTSSDHNGKTCNLVFEHFFLKDLIRLSSHYLVFLVIQ